MGILKMLNNAEGIPCEVGLLHRYRCCVFGVISSNEHSKEMGGGEVNLKKVFRI